MANKITSKNLSYDQTLPPFLARLRGQQASGSASPDPILSQRRRAARIRTASEEAEDAPIVVDEDGNVVDVKVSNDGDVEQPKASDENEDGEEEAKAQEKEPERVAGIGATKKRKVGKVIGGDAEDEGGVGAAIKNAVKASKAVAKDITRKGLEPAEKKSEKGGKKKAKKIKLSFGDEEG